MIETAFSSFYILLHPFTLLTMVVWLLYPVLIPEHESLLIPDSPFGMDGVTLDPEKKARVVSCEL